MEIATAAFSTHYATMAHPMLQQDATGPVPVGIHNSTSTDYAFPREDEEGNCWIPEDFSKGDLEMSEEGFEGENKFVNYQDPASTVLRADCATASWMEVCSVPLFWEEVDCDIYTKKAKKKTSDKKKPLILPVWAVVITQTLQILWELNVVMIVTLPSWAMLALVAAIDWLIDWIWMGLFSWWCKVCAMIFIWIFNIAFLPFHIFGWL